MARREAFVEGKLETPKHLARWGLDFYFAPKYEEFKTRTFSYHTHFCYEIRTRSEKHDFGN